MQDYEVQFSGEVLTIPHNGNLSRGVMFALENAKGVQLSRSYTESRSRWEPLFEVTQIKGNSETHPILSPDDEFENFERIDTKSNRHSPKYLNSLRTLGYKDQLILVSVGLVVSSISAEKVLCGRLTGHVLKSNIIGLKNSGVNNV